MLLGFSLCVWMLSPLYCQGAETLSGTNDIKVHVLPEGEHHVIDKRFESYDDTDFTVGSVSVNEGVGVFPVCVRGGPNKRAFSLFTTHGPASSCPNGPCPTALEGLDYERLYVDEFLPHPGLTTCFNFTLLDDSLVEGREFFLVGLLDHIWGEVLSLLPVTILDNDSPRLLSQQDIVSESVGESEFCLVGGAVDLPLVVQARGPDLQDMTQFLTISPEEVVCVNYTVVDDQLFEGLEVATITVQSANTSIGNFSESFLVYIGDNDETPQFEVSSFTVSEGDPQFPVCIVYNTDSPGPVDSSLVFTDGSARSDLDYTGADVMVSISPGGRVCTTVNIADDIMPERTESFTVSLNSSNNQLQPLTLTVTVRDNDVISFEESVYSSVEGENGVEVCLRVPDGRGTRQGLFTTESGTATERLDYFPIRYIFFNITDTERRCFFIYNYRDNLPEGREEFTVLVYTLFSQRFATDVSRAQITIVDDDVRSCGNLTDPDNGVIVSLSDNNNPGSVALYSCLFGYRLTGIEGSTRTCLPTGVWEGTDPTCRAILCPVLSDPNNGRVSVSGQTVSSLATYSCNTGYQLVGDEQRYCLSLVGGTWSGSPPLCTLIVCPLLVPPPNGTVVLPSERTLGSVAMYSCEDGRMLVGSASRVCQNNGSWSGQEPACISPVTAMSPVTLTLVNSSPQIDGDNVLVEFSLTGPVDTVTISLGHKRIEENFRYSKEGRMMFTDVSAGVHSLVLVATSLVSEEEVVVQRVFETSSDPTFCAVHLINNGPVMVTHKLWVEFGAVPVAKSYRCVLDRGPKFDCESPLELDELKPGAHTLTISHPDTDLCEHSTPLLVHFNIENTPDNPHNNV